MFNPTFLHGDTSTFLNFYGLWKKLEVRARRFWGVNMNVWCKLRLNKFRLVQTETPKKGRIINYSSFIGNLLAISCMSR